MSYIFGKLWHLAIIWAIRKAFQCILQGVRFLLANHTRLSPTSENESYIVWKHNYICNESVPTIRRFVVENLVEIPGGGAHKGYVGKNPADPSLLASDPSYCRLQFSTHLFNCATPSSGNQNKIWLNHLAPKFGKSYLTFHLSEHGAGFMFGVWLNVIFKVYLRLGVIWA